MVRGMNKLNPLLLQQQLVFVRSVDGRKMGGPLADAMLKVELLPGRHVLSLLFQDSTLGIRSASAEDCKVAFVARAGQSYTAFGDYGPAPGDASEWRCYIRDDATGERFPGSLLPPVFPHEKYAGFTCKPPIDNGWGIASWTEDALVFKRNTQSPAHNLVLFVRRSKHGKQFQAPDDFLAYVKDLYFNVNPEQYEFLERDAGLDPRYGANCVHYRFAYRVHLKGRRGDRSYVSTGQCYDCLHPRAPQYEYEICAQDDSRSGEVDAGFVAEGNAFLDSFSFTEIGR
ncbi:MAG TPA: hypothetical protein VI078_10990 [bacterium]